MSRALARLQEQRRRLADQEIHRLAGEPVTQPRNLIEHHARQRAKRPGIEIDDVGIEQHLGAGVCPETTWHGLLALSRAELGEATARLSRECRTPRTLPARCGPGPAPRAPCFRRSLSPGRGEMLPRPAPPARSPRPRYRRRPSRLRVSAKRPYESALRA